MSEADALRIARIVDHLQAVAFLRAGHAADPALGGRVLALKAYQQRRFERCYSDLLYSARFGKAAKFFLQELYGPGDFTRRDAQFSRVVPTLVRLFPESVVGTVECLAQLHSLSERLDDAMARVGVEASWHRDGYVAAWRAIDSDSDRRLQLDLVLQVGRSLDQLTRNRLLRRSLHWMRGPASAAGLGDLQRFLEVGFDTFAEMKGANEFLATVQIRESQFIDAMGTAGLDWDQNCVSYPVLGFLP